MSIGRLAHIDPYCSSSSVPTWDGFEQEAAALEHLISACEIKISSQEYSQMRGDIPALERDIEMIYISIEELKCKSDDISKCSSEHTISKVKNQIHILEDRAASLHCQFLEKVKVRQLHDNIEAVMWKTLEERRSRGLNKTAFKALQNEWKEVVVQYENTVQTIAKRHLNIPKHTKDSLEFIPGQIGYTKNGMRGISSFPQEPIIELVSLVKDITTCNQADLKVKRAEIDDLLQIMHPHLQYRLDYFVYLFSPEPKGGDEWGKQHRYDNCDVFQKAFGSAVWDHVRWTMPKSFGVASKVKSQDSLFTQFYKLRRVQDESVETHGAYDKLFTNLTKREELMQATQYANMHIMFYPYSLCRALWIKAGREEFQKIFYSKTYPLPYQPGFTIKKTPPKEKTELEKVRDKLAFACEQKNVESTIIREYIRGCLNKLSTSEKWSVEEHVYHHSKDPGKGGERWGEYHAYDNPHVLLEAVKSALLMATTQK